MKADLIPIKLPYPVEGTETAGYIVNYDEIKGYSLHIKYNQDVVVVPYKRDYEDLLKELNHLLEMQKSGIQLWLNRMTQKITTDKI